MLGISVYFQDLDLVYLEEAAKYGATMVFTSLHIPEEDYSTLDEKLPIFLAKCQELGLSLVPDVSPVTFEKLGVAPNEYAKLKEMGFQFLRLDYGFDDYEVIKVLSKDFHLMLNASVVDEVYIQGALAAQVPFEKITLMHNFYPHQGTGLGFAYFMQKNEVFHRFGLRIQAFVCGDELKRFPLYEGLPTLEKHRTMHPYVAAVELQKVCGVDDIIIGDSKAKIETLRMIQTYMNDHTMIIKAHFEPGYEQFYEGTYPCRKDLSDRVVRIITPRISDVAVYHNTIRPRGAITMDNRLFGRYGGEVQLLKEDFGMDARVNVIGYLHPEFIDLLDYIDADTTIKFERMETSDQKKGGLVWRM